MFNMCHYLMILGPGVLSDDEANRQLMGMYFRGVEFACTWHIHEELGNGSIVMTGTYDEFVYAFTWKIQWGWHTILRSCQKTCWIMPDHEALDFVRTQDIGGFIGNPNIRDIPWRICGFIMCDGGSPVPHGDRESGKFKAVDFESSLFECDACDEVLKQCGCNENSSSCSLPWNYHIVIDQDGISGYYRNHNWVPEC